MVMLLKGFLISVPLLFLYLCQIHLNFPPNFLNKILFLAMNLKNVRLEKVNTNSIFLLVTYRYTLQYLNRVVNFDNNLVLVFGLSICSWANGVELKERSFSLLFMSVGVERSLERCPISLNCASTKLLERRTIL